MPSNEWLNNTIKTLEPTPPSNSISTAYLATTETNVIEVLKPGGTPSPVKTPRKRKRVGSDSTPATPLRRSGRSQSPKKQQPGKKKAK